MKTLKIAFGLILLIGVFQNVFSQQVKTYQGPYEKGNAVYQYYEDENYNRIYQGTFKYTAEHISIIGQFKDNKRVGHWIITKTVLPPLDNFKETITGEYINGNMDGSWNLERIDLNTKKILLGSDAYFIKGYIMGSFLYYNANFRLQFSETTPLIVSGQFNIKGKLDSTWTIKYKKNKIPFEDIRKFKNGEIYFYLLRNVSTGEPIEKYDNSTSPKVYYINSYTTTSDFIEYLKDTPDGIYSSVFDLWKRIKTPNSYLFEDPYIIVRSSGEKLLDIFLNQSDTTFIDERTLNSKEKNQINQLEFTSIISKADSAFNNKKYDDATNLYRKALLLKDSPYADSQLEKLSNISRIEYEKKDRENSKKLQEKNDSLYRETDLYKDQLKMRKEAEENSVPKYKRIINVIKKK